MFKISHRQTILRASLIGCFIVAVLSTAAYFITSTKGDTNAITQEGDNTQIFIEDGTPTIYYGSTNTRYYSANVNGESYDAYCAEPPKATPHGWTFPATTSFSNSSIANKIKLIIYLNQHKPQNSIFNGVANDSSWGEARGGESLGNKTIQQYRLFAFTHAVIGHLFGGYNSGLNSDQLSKVREVADSNGDGSLAKIINENTGGLWDAANAYQLYRTNNTGHEGIQIVVWIEQKPKPAGKIIVRKCDAEIFDKNGSCIAQGDTNFSGIKFTLFDGNTQVATKTLAGESNTVTFTELDVDKTYRIEESGSNTYYNVTSSSQSTKPTEAGVTVTFKNTIKKGKLTVNKTDKDTGTCTNSGDLSFAGTKFTLTNIAKTNATYYNGSIIAVSTPVATKTMAAGECSFTFENLPYGTYRIQETTAASGYVVDSPNNKTFTIPTNNNANITIKFENQPIRGDITFTKKDTTTNTPMANTVFEISSINSSYTENHIVVSDANGVVDTRASVNPHTNHTNGYDELYYSSEAPIAYAGYGTWFGFKSKATTPRNDVGAFPAGTYLIQELKCDTNMFCTNLNNEKKTFTISTNGQVVNLNDSGKDYWANNCADFSISTQAVDKEDGDKYLKAGENTVIKDTIDYCAKSGYTYTITGTLMDKSTGKPLLINGETITQSLTIPSDADDCGTVEMFFPVNTSEIAGKSIVVFEKLYYKNEIKASHEDITDSDQTVDVISLGTIATDNSDDDKLIVPSTETAIKDTVSYCAIAGQPYTITGVLMDKTTGSPVLVNDEPVTQSVTFTPEQKCGTVEMVFPAIDTTAIAGHPVVVYETLYKVTSTSDPDSKEPIISHEDLEDEDQTVYLIDISTIVQPTEDGTKIFPVNADVTVTDMVHYCLQPGLEYTVTGVVMDKSTGNGLLVNSKLVEQSVTFTPTESCGEFPMEYSFNTEGLSGAQLVIFENLYHDGKLLIEHKDINNELESFEIDITPPETGFITKNASGSQETSHHELLIIAAIAISPIAVYVFGRRQARKRFLNR